MFVFLTFNELERVAWQRDQFLLRQQDQPLHKRRGQRAVHQVQGPIL